MKRSVFGFMLFTFALLILNSASATHIRSVDLRVETTANPLAFNVTLIVYRNTLSGSQAGAFGFVNFGDNRISDLRSLDSSPEREIRSDLGPNIETVKFTFSHVYNNHGTYQITYIEGDRSSNIRNIPFSDDIDYMTYVSFNTIAAANSHLPHLTIPPVDRACLFNIFTHNPGVVDEDGDLITFELAVPSEDVGQEIQSYISPLDRQFYLNFDNGNEAANGPPTFAIDSLTGQLTWDAPGMEGEYSIAFKIHEWRKNELTEEYELISTTIRDMQIIVQDCINMRPTASIPANLCILPGTKIEETVYGFDPENRDIKLEAISELFDLPADQSPASYDPFPPAFRLPDPVKGYDSINFEWTTTCNHVRTQPYQVVFKISDKPPHEISLVTYNTWTIKVMGPPPTWKSPKIDFAKREARLSWQQYTCANADRIQIWRRVDSYPYSPKVCDVGIPKTLDFDLIGDVDGTDTVFIDDNKGRKLADGAQYCYRIVAVFNQVSLASSKPSLEFCFDPIETDAPVITHVSVEKTAEVNGAIRVSWRRPFNINKTQFPEPYDYHIYRQYGFGSESTMDVVGVAPNDTTFLDENINTLDSVFHYRIVLFAKPQGNDQFVPIDTSAKASSERLSLFPGDKMITLAWRDSVPWSNVVNTNPWHVIYRKAGVDSEEPFVKYDSVNVSLNGFTYVDEAVASDQLYAYKILVRGTYGNPAIELQENMSQIAVAYPDNDLLPCAPIVIVEKTNCEIYLSAENCDQTLFSNAVHWHADNAQGCRADIDHYKIYTTATSTGELEFADSNYIDTLFNDNDLQSFAKCYRISAVDQSGQEGPMSEIQCNDNCTSFELPNVFTPNGDGCNDVFSTYYVGEEQDGCRAVNSAWCPRFVEVVDLSIFNRWGEEVYQYRSGDGKPATIYWNGKDRSDHDVEVGIYFFSASVQFNVLNPQKKKGKYKGWVQVIR
jgi:hypothetical protein